MNKIPAKLRKEMSEDPYYRRCARKNRDCNGRITWEHAFLYAGKQVQEKWAIIPLCWFHHLGVGLNKKINQMIAISRATLEEIEENYRGLVWIKKKQLAKKS